MGTGSVVLEKLVADLTAALGDNLASLLLYGSAARPGAPANVTHDVLLVVREPTDEVLLAAAPALTRWRRAGQKPPLVFGEAEWRSSADVFPLEIEDMRSAHRLLAGRDPFDAVTLRAADMRSQLEREVRGKLLHLRAAWVAGVDDGALLADLLAGTVSSVLVLLRGALRLAGKSVPEHDQAVVAAAAELVGFDVAAFEWPLAARTGKRPGKLRPRDPRAAEYVRAVGKLAQWVDRA